MQRERKLGGWRFESKIIYDCMGRGLGGGRASTQKSIINTSFFFSSFSSRSRYMNSEPNNGETANASTQKRNLFLISIACFWFRFVEWKSKKRTWNSAQQKQEQRQRRRCWKPTTPDSTLFISIFKLNNLERERKIFSFNPFPQISSK